MKPEFQIGIEQIVDKLIAQVVIFERRHPNTEVNTDVTGIVLSYMLKDSISDLNKELAKHDLELIEYFAMDKANNTWHVVKKISKN